MKEFKVNEAELLVSTEGWEEVKVSDTDIIYKPRYLHKNCNWENVDQLKQKKIPFLHVKYAAQNILSIEAQTGIVREVPIFYLIKSGKIILTDSPVSLLRSFDIQGLDELSVREFLSYGYVTSQRTLLNGVYSIQAGESLSYDGDKVKIANKYIYNSAEITNKPREKLLWEFKSKSETVFHELIESLKGKEAFVPLSGGYDSRFIVSMLKLGGFDNVTCFAWGKEGDKEIEVSRSVAKKLGYKWQVINYSNESWKKVTQSDWFFDCMHYASKYTSIAGSASLPFLEYLRKCDGREDKVLIPGHAPISRKVISPHENVTESILENNFLGGTFNYKGNEELYAEIDLQVDKYSKQTTAPYRVYEMWNWRERQSKFLANSNRYYEYLSCNWNMPLWDIEFVDFWSSVPLEEKQNLKLYDDFLESFLFNKLDLQYDLDKTRKSRQTKSFSIRNKMRLLRRYKMYRKLSYKIRSNIITNPYGFDYALSELYERSAKKFTRGYRSVEQYKKKVGIAKDAKPYAYLSQFTLSQIIDDMKRGTFTITS